MGASGPSCKLQFTYRHQKALSKSSATLYIDLVPARSTGQFEKTISTISSVDRWTNYTVTLGQLNAGWQVKIYGECDVVSQGSPYKDMELDNLRFIDCDAQAQPAQANLTCDFERDMCGWFEWNRGTIQQIDWV